MTTKALEHKCNHTYINFSVQLQQFQFVFDQIIRRKRNVDFSFTRRITNLTPHSTSILLERKTKKPTLTVFSRESLLYTTTNSIQYYPQYVYDFKKTIPCRFLAAGIAKAALGTTFGLRPHVISKLCLRFKVSQKSLGFFRVPKH